MGGDLHGEFGKERRYKEFLALRRRLRQQWPGCYVPSLPPKKVFGNTGPDFVEDRRVLLESFAKQTLSLSHLLASQATEDFIRGPANYHTLQVAEPKLTDIYNKYRSCFDQYSHDPINNDMIAALESHLSEFVGVHKILVDTEKVLLSAVTSFDEWLKTRRGLVAAMEGYEQAFGGTAGAGGLFPSEDKISNPFRPLLIWMRTEILDIRAMIDTIKSKDEFILRKS
jgi:hypothetical protein